MLDEDSLSECSHEEVTFISHFKARYEHSPADKYFTCAEAHWQFTAQTNNFQKGKVLLEVKVLQKHNKHIFMLVHMNDITLGLWLQLFFSLRLKRLDRLNKNLWHCEYVFLIYT